jgi:photosystem II stability/assembly factor-like uncharacterized protein
VTRLFAATGDSIVCLDEEGSSWSAIVSLAGSGAHCVACRGDLLLAGTRGRGLRLSEDGGETWTDVGLPERDVFSVAISAADGALYAGCEPSRLFRSQDRGRTWHALDVLLELPSKPGWSFPPRPWTSHVRWIAPSPHDGRLLLVGIELGGLMRSEDGGASWADHRPGAQLDVHSIAWHPTARGRAYQAGGGGAAWSSDGGDTWQPADAGRDRNYTWAVAPDPDDADRWYLSASTGPFAAHGGRDPQARIYRWSGSGPWQALGGGLPEPLDAMPYALLAADGRLFAGLADGRIYASPDRGDSWEALAVRGDPVGELHALTAAE